MAQVSEPNSPALKSVNGAGSKYGGNTTTIQLQRDGSWLCETYPKRVVPKNCADMPLPTSATYNRSLEALRSYSPAKTFEVSLPLLATLWVRLMLRWVSGSYGIGPQPYIGRLPWFLSLHRV